MTAGSGLRPGGAYSLAIRRLNADSSPATVWSEQIDSRPITALSDILARPGHR